MLRLAPNGHIVVLEEGAGEDEETSSLDDEAAETSVDSLQDS